jgi:hypothetical protein
MRATTTRTPPRGSASTACRSAGASRRSGWARSGPLTLGGGEAVTNARQDLGGGALVADRTLQATWNGRLDIGRPFALLPGLEFLPMAGIGAAH